MKIEIVTTGTELLLGQIINANSSYLAAELNKMGFDVFYQSTVGDNRERMEEVLCHALTRADIVITSGGLGPTQGDITKEVSAKIFGRKLLLHEPSLARINAHFKCVGREAMPESNRRQAMLPEGAVVLENHAGTAPGIVLEHEGKFMVHLPGPPFELKDMFQRTLKSFLTQKFGVAGVIVSRVLNTFGIGESVLEDEIKDLILRQSNPTLALLARPGEVIVRITAKAESERAAKALIAGMEQEIRSRVGKFIFAVDDNTLEAAVGVLLAEKNLSIACAESCTGGLLSSRLTDVPGSSKYVHGSIVSYTDRVKADELGVPEALLETKGAVSEEVAVAMAEGVLAKFSTDIGVSLTGIAGPDGGTEEKPVGLVYIAVSGKNGTRCTKNLLKGGRTSIKYRATQTALDMIRNYVKEI